eukprot:TRINITY_DN2526_c0_g1_i1.p1 TRINITY_DN2526_c0_g1~~TRINITY_DN2526_c0_g1_i1.p1  ORF type:complete len:292 (+),score=61.74 TRINITY_DN2526_c0_g1_i1:33-908(+)
MTQYLPPTLLALFAPRPPIPYLAPTEKSTPPPLSGVAAFLGEFEKEEIPPPEKIDNTIIAGIITKQKRKEKKRKAKEQRHASKIEEAVKAWDPHKDEKATADPYKTLFVARMAFDTTEHKLRKEFEHYGAIHKIRVVQDPEGKPRGYAFVEFEREKDMRVAYKQADGRKIDGRRIVVDVERGRTVRNWKPRRLGGGLGFTRAGSESMNQKHSGREPTRSDDRQPSPERRSDRPERPDDRRDDRRRDDRRDDRRRDDRRDDRRRDDRRDDRRDRERSRSRDRGEKRDRDRRH